MGKNQNRLYSKIPIIEYKEWVEKKYGKLKTEDQRQSVFDEYYLIRNKNKFNILNYGK